MGERNSYAPGTFCWTDLGTTDAESAKGFYTDLFEWDYEDREVEGAGVYTMFSKNGMNVCALYEQNADRLQAGWTPNWLQYVSVNDIDATAERASALGAELITEPIDVLDEGRTAIVSDPTGGTFALWQPGNHFGAALVNDPGSMSWNELNTPDASAAVAFYSELFGWTADDLGSGGQYYVVKNGDRSNGGITPLRPGDDAGQAYWLPYFTVDDTDATAEKADHLGGNLLVQPMDGPQGRIAVVQDAQGAAFALFQGEVED